MRRYGGIETLKKKERCERFGRLFHEVRLRFA